MLEITAKDIDEIQPMLLGKHKRFTDEQIGIIRYQGAGDIVACPGSGKTTVLIAKIAILMKKIKEDNMNDGICIITHTNVGVEEILSKLHVLGIHQVSYPHFIGTIHEFFNSFFAIKAYSMLSNSDRFFFMENEEFKVHFAKFFEKHKPPTWGVKPPFSAVDKTKLSIGDNGELALLGFEDKSYRCELLNTFKEMFHSGYLRHNETISLSQYYVKKNREKLGKAFASRFKYFFIDETQDTSVEQYKIIQTLLQDNQQTTVQCYGDPYQALYNLYFGEPDAWTPPVEERKEIATSNRFGENIAKILRTTCIERYDHLLGSETISSLQPHIFLYRDQSKVLESFCKIIESYKLSSSRNKVYAVSQHHDAITTYHQYYKKFKSDKKSNSSLADCLQTVYKVLSRTLRKYDGTTGGRLKFAVNRLNDLLRLEFPTDHSLLRSSLAKTVREVNLGHDFNLEFKEFSLVYDALIKERFGIALEVEEVVSSLEMIKSHIVKSHKVNKTSNQIDNTYQYNEISVHLDTVHGVKGETHLATLLLESSVYRDEGSDLSDILPFLLGNYDTSLVRQMQIKDTLKIAYVALSRPTDFVGIAIKEDNVKEEEITAAVQHGWEIVRVDA